MAKKIKTKQQIRATEVKIREVSNGYIVEYYDEIGCCRIESIATTLAHALLMAEKALTAK